MDHLPHLLKHRKKKDELCNYHVQKGGDTRTSCSKTSTLFIQGKESVSQSGILQPLEGRDQRKGKDHPP